MATLLLETTLITESPGGSPINLANVLPSPLSFNVGEDKVERSLTLNNTDFKLMDSHEITPFFWIYVNNGIPSDNTDNDLIVDFGGGDNPIILQPGFYGLHFGPVKPVAKAVTGASRIFYAVFSAP